MNDLDLLRKFEPVVRFTDGEFFFPCAVDEYVRYCSLWLRDNRRNEQQLVAEGDLTVEKLARYNEVPPGYTLYLRFVDQPLEPLEYQRWLHRPERPLFRAPGRLSRVGLFSRILDSFFNLSLLLRGKVPGGTTAAADIKYRQVQAQDSRFVYYGRVIRDGGYIVLHYLFFYTMNNWRSSFYGVNDHEADWEQIFIYLSEEEAGEPLPRWVAYASHDFSGDDLRRRWDDPELHKVDENHPIVYAGAGSHANYFLPGEYLMGVEPEFMRPVKNGLIALRKFWVEKLGQGSIEKVEEQVGSLLSIPFIDYARGDGVGIGPGEKNSWSPIVLTEETGWSEQYRGLWGLDTQDPLGGERAPAGPKYNRDGSVRTAWYDPLGWAGLDKVPPPSLTPAQLREHISALTQEQETLKEEIGQKREAVRSLALEVQALHETDYLNHLYRTQAEQLAAAQKELQTLYARSTELAETSTAARSYLHKIERGDWGDPQAHLHHKHPPQPPVGQQARLTELWAAVSGGLLLLALTVLILLFPEYWLGLGLTVAAIFITIEATVRGRLANLLLNVTIGLAAINGLVLIWEFWWLVLLVAAFVMVIIMIRENLHELWQK
jgi:hypothetical protein